MPLPPWSKKSPPRVLETGGKIGQLFLLLLLLLGCQRKAKEVSPWTGDLVMAVDMIEPLDPILPAHSFEIALLRNQVFETLVRLSPSGEPIPHLARRWEVTLDSLVYRFELRRGVFFHPSPAFPGGKAQFLTAEDVVFSLKRALSRKSYYYRYFDGVIEGMRDFSEGRSRGKVSGLRVLGPFRLEIRLERPYPGFLKELANPAFAVVPRAPVLDSGDEFGYRPVGTGPFRVARFSSDTLYLVRNERYWGTKPRLPGIRAVAYGDPARERLALQSGMLDWGSYDPTLAQNESYQVVELHHPHHLILWVFNPRKASLREQVIHAIDLKKLTQAVQLPGTAITPVTHLWGEDSPLPSPAAPSIPLVLRVHLDPVPEVLRLFQRMRLPLRNNGLVLNPVRSFLKADLYMTSVFLDFDAPRALLLPFYGKASDLANPWDIRNPRLDTLIERIPSSETDFRTCAQLLKKEIPVIFLFRLEREHALVHRRIQGLPSVLSPSILLNTIQIKAGA